MKDLASEIRMYDQDTLLVLIKNHKYRELECLLCSIIEVYFPKNILLFSWSADGRSSWEGDNFIAFDFELLFKHASFFFSLRLSARSASVSIIQVVEESTFRALDPEDLERFLNQKYKLSKSA